MSRGAFNNTVDLFYGPQSVAGAPGTQYAAALPCRLVEQTQIFQQEFPFSLSHAWMTIQEVAPNIPVTISPAVGYTFDNWFQADRVAIPSGTPVQWFVCRRELVSPWNRPSYWRVLLVSLAALETPPWLPPSPLPPIPPPVVPPAPGPTCADATVLAEGDDAEGELVLGELTLQWWEFVAPFDGDWRVVFTSEGDAYPSDVRLQVFGGSCDDLDPLLATIDVDGCASFFLLSGQGVKVRVYSPIWDGSTYAFTIESGTCS